MNAAEMTRYLERLCEDLDAGRPIRTWSGWARKLVLPAAFGLSVAMGGCGDDRTTPLYAAPFDGGAEAAASTDGGTDGGAAPLYAAPFDGGEVPLYAAPFDGGSDGGASLDAAGTLYGAPFDGGAAPLYAAPFDGG